MRAASFSKLWARRGMFLCALACLVCWNKGIAQKTATVIQQVNQAPAPPIAWNTPEAIPFGTPLSALQLNATSAAAGIFTYQPASGAILPPGTGTLSVIFSPSDQNYHTGSTSVSIVVVPPGSSSFTILPLSASSPESSLTLPSGAPATVQVAVGPIGEFHQPVTLSCRNAPPGRHCLFSPEVVRPTTDPVQVSLTFAPTGGTGVSSSAGLLPGITSSALLSLLFRRRLRMRTGRQAVPGAVLAFPLLAMAAGCGCEFSWHTEAVEKVEIVGSSLVEIHIAYVYVSRDDAHFPTGQPYYPHNGKNEKEGKIAGGNLSKISRQGRLLKSELPPLCSHSSLNVQATRGANSAWVPAGYEANS